MSRGAAGGFCRDNGTDPATLQAVPRQNPTGLQMLAQVSRAAAGDTQCENPANGRRKGAPGGGLGIFSEFFLPTCPIFGYSLRHDGAERKRDALPIKVAGSGSRSGHRGIAADGLYAARSVVIPDKLIWNSIT